MNLHPSAEYFRFHRQPPDAGRENYQKSPYIHPKSTKNWLSTKKSRNQIIQKSSKPETRLPRNQTWRIPQMKLPIKRTPRDVYTWDPFDEIRRMQEYMDQMFRTFPALENRLSGDVFSPLTDVMEEEDRVIVTTDMPGIEKESIELSLKDNALVISAGRGKEEESEKEGYIRKERTYTRYYREILLPEGVSEEGATAKLLNGVLTVTLPKLKKEAGKKIQIE